MSGELSTSLNYVVMREKADCKVAQGKEGQTDSAQSHAYDTFLSIMALPLPSWIQSTRHEETSVELFNITL